MEDVIKKLEGHYQCEVFDMQKKRKSYRVKTNKGIWFLKGYSDPNKAKWVIQLSAQLACRGFKQGLRFIQTVREKPFFEANGCYYTVMEELKGRDGSYANLKDAMRAVACLAKFHEAAVHIKGNLFIDRYSVPLVEKWMWRIHLFKDIVRQASQCHKKNHLIKIVLAKAPEIVKQAEQTLDIAMRSQLCEKFNSALQRRTVAHRDLASHNFLISKDSTYLIDYDTAYYDTQLVDLVQIFGRILVQQNWDLGVFSKLIEQYRRYRPLLEKEVSLIYCLLRYPDDFMREVNGLFEIRRQPQLRRLASYLETMMRNWENRENFFAGYSHFLA